MKRFFVRAIPLFLLLFILTENTKPEPCWEGKYKKEYKKLFKELEKKGFSCQELEKIFSDKRVEFYEELVKPSEKKSKEEIEKGNEQYLKSLLSEESVKRGKNFLLANDSLLSAAEKKFGADKEIIVSIFRSETNLGEYFGVHRVFNTYNTLFIKHYFKKVKKWARKELICFLIISKDNEFDPLTIWGSTAGAFGWSQFIPSSWKLALDGDGDSKIDLFNLADAAFSAANYLKECGWQKSKWNEQNKQAIFSYNRSWFYVKSIYLYAKAIGFNAK